MGLSSDFPTKEIVEHIGHESGVPEKNLQNEFGRCPAKADLVSVRIGKVGFSAFLFPMEISLSSVDKEIGKLCESTESGVSVLITLPRNEFVVPATQDNVILCGSCTSHSGVGVVTHSGVGVVVGFHNVSVFACFYYIILTFDQILSKNFHFFLFFFFHRSFPTLFYYIIPITDQILSRNFHFFSSNPVTVETGDRPLHRCFILL